MDVELYCGDHVTVDTEPRSYFAECPLHGDYRAIISIDGRPV